MSQQSTTRRMAFLNKPNYYKNPCTYFQRPFLYSTIANESLSYIKQIERRPRKYGFSTPVGEKNPYIFQDPNIISNSTLISYANRIVEGPELNNNTFNPINLEGLNNIEKVDENKISPKSTSNRFNANYEEQQSYKAFFSLRCSTDMVEIVTKIKNTLTANDKENIFLCKDDAKTTFRDNISRAIMNCDFFVPFIDESWCESEECGDETNLANNLSRHSKPRKPVIIPIVFKKNNVQNHHRCLILTSTWNSIFLESNRFEDADYIYAMLSEILHKK